jgi:hypothetical protein
LDKNHLWLLVQVLPAGCEATSILRVAGLLSSTYRTSMENNTMSKKDKQKLKRIEQQRDLMKRMEKMTPEEKVYEDFHYQTNGYYLGIKVDENGLKRPDYIDEHDVMADLPRAHFMDRMRNDISDGKSRGKWAKRLIDKIQWSHNLKDMRRRMNDKIQRDAVTFADLLKLHDRAFDDESKRVENMRLSVKQKVDPIPLVAVPHMVDVTETKAKIDFYFVRSEVSILEPKINEKAYPNANYINKAYSPVRATRGKCMCCDFSGIPQVCEECHDILNMIKKFKGYSPRLGLKRTQLVKIYKKEGQEGIERHIERTREKQQIKRPKCGEQPYRDWDLEDLDQVLPDPRSIRRMREFLASKQRENKIQYEEELKKVQEFVSNDKKDQFKYCSLMNEIGETVPNIKKILDGVEIKEQGGGLVDAIMSALKGALDFCLNTGVVELVITVVMMSLLVAATVYLLRWEPESVAGAVLKYGSLIGSITLLLGTTSGVLSCILVFISKLAEKFSEKSIISRDEVHLIQEYQTCRDRAKCYTFEVTQKVYYHPDRPKFWRDTDQQKFYEQFPNGLDQRAEDYSKELEEFERKLLIAETEEFKEKYKPKRKEKEKRTKDWQGPEIEEIREQDGDSVWDTMVNGLYGAYTTVVEKLTPGGLIEGSVKKLHTVAQSVRDLKTLYEVFAPIFETLFGMIYEAVTNTPYVSSKDALYMNSLIPLFKRMDVLEADPKFQQKLIGDVDFRKEMRSIIRDYEELRNGFFKVAPERLNTVFLSRAALVAAWKGKILEIEISGRSRPKPLWAYIYSSTSQGKTEMANRWFKDVHENMHKFDKRERYPFADNMVYSRRRENEYWDGYNEHEYVLFNEVFQAKDSAVRYLEAMELMTVVDTAPTLLHMAAVHDKANHYLKATAIVTTTNAGVNPKSLNLEELAALYKRRDLVMELVLDIKYPLAKPSDNDYVKNWRIILHDSYGKRIQEITYDESVALGCEMIAAEAAKHNEKPAVIAVEPTESNKDLMKTLVESSTKSRKTVSERKNPDAVLEQGQFMSKKAITLPFLEEGLVYTELEDEKLPEDATVWYSATIDYIDEDDSVRLGYDNENFDIFIKSDDIKKKSLIGRRLRALVRIFERKVRTVKQWTVQQYEKFRKFGEDFYIYVSTSFAMNFFKSVFEQAKRKVVELLEHHVWGPILKGVGICLGLAAVIGSAFGLYKYLTRPETQSEDDQPKKGKVRRVGKGSAANEFDYQVDKAIAKYGVGRHIHFQGEENEVKEQFQAADYSLMDLMEQNMYHIQTLDAQGGGHCRGQMTFMGSYTALTVWHIAKWVQRNAEKNGRLEMTRISRKFGTMSLSVCCSEVKVARIPGSEAALLRFPRTVPQHHKIDHHVIRKIELEEGQKHGVAECNVGSCRDSGAANHIRVGLATLEVYKHKDEPEGLFWICKNPATDTEDGMSGGLWWTSNLRMPHRIIGTHSYGGRGVTIGSLITYEDLQEALKQDPGLFFPEEVELAEAGAPELAQNYASVGKVVSKQSANLPRKNPIEMSPIAHELYSMGWQTTTLPTALKEHIPFQWEQMWRDRGVKFDFHTTDNEKHSPLAYAKKKMNVELPPFPLIAPYQLFPDWYTTWRRPKNGRLLIYSLSDVMYGNEKLGREGVERSTSPGYPFTVTKGMVTRPQLLGTCIEEAHPEFMKRIQRIIDTNQGDGNYIPIYTTSQKIERKVAAKVIIPTGTRFFWAGPLDNQVVGQCLLGHLMETVMENPTGEWTIGMNPHSTMWGGFTRRMFRHPNSMNSDASKWDLSQEDGCCEYIGDQTEKYFETVELVNRLADRIPTKDVPKHVKKMMRTVVKAYLLLVNNLYLAHFGVRSGNFITTLFNCMLNSIRWRIVFVLAAMEHGVKDFNPKFFWEKFVEAAFHGDDAWLTVSDEVAAWFNQKSAKYLWKKVFGIELSDPEKSDAELPLFTPPGREWFLKRLTRVEGGHAYAPLAIEVIKDMVLWVTDPNRAPQICADNVRAAMMELAHHPKEVADPIEQDLRRACMRCKMPWLAESRDYYDTLIRGQGAMSDSLRVWLKSQFNPDPREF